MPLQGPMLTIHLASQQGQTSCCTAFTALLRYFEAAQVGGSHVLIATNGILTTVDAALPNIALHDICTSWRAALDDQK